MSKDLSLIKHATKLIDKREINPLKITAQQDNYPLIDNFAVSISPFDEPGKLVEMFSKHGFVVVKDAFDEKVFKESKNRVIDMLSIMSEGKFTQSSFDATNFDTDTLGTPIAQRGFFELFHDDCLAKLRQSPGFYLTNALIWGRTDLWVTFDRLAIKSSKKGEALPWHVDQNPFIDPGFRTLQGLAALVDSPEEKGTFAVCPGSRQYFGEYYDNTLGHYVPLNLKSDGAEHILKKAQSIPMKAGDYVIWDSRTTHGNTKITTENHCRLAALLACGPAGGWKKEAGQIRLDAWKNAEGFNDRDALMHASFKPRYTNKEKLQQIRKKENFTGLGKKLYGIEKY